jgi:hypothetical protein
LQVIRLQSYGTWDQACWSFVNGACRHVAILYELHKMSQSNHCTKIKSFNLSNVQCNLPADRCLQQQDLFHLGEEANMISTPTRKYATMCMLAWFFIAQKFEWGSFNTRWSPITSSRLILHNLRWTKNTHEVQQTVTMQAPPIGKKGRQYVEVAYTTSMSVWTQNKWDHRQQVTWSATSSYSSSQKALWPWLQWQ